LAPEPPLKAASAAEGLHVFCEMYKTWYKMTVMLQSGLKIEQVITHRYNWKDFEQDFQAMRTGSSGKVILDWSDVRQPQM
jgi:threonine dehydrogenase-like Zn-dependent dehydrogenase